MDDSSPAAVKDVSGRAERGGQAGRKGRKQQSLSGKIFNSVLVFTLAILLIFSVATTTIFYFLYEKEAETELIAQAQDAAAYLNAASDVAAVNVLKGQFEGWLRYTLIAPDGSVLYDSSGDSAAMENHANRPEFQKAEQGGQASTSRYSTTLGTDTIYAAVKLDDGSVIRLSESRHSLMAFLANMLVPILVAVVVATVLVFILSRMLTRRIMKPVDALNFRDPLQNEIYVEMAPLLERIDNQQKQLKQQNKELALAESMRRDFSANVSHEMKTPLQVISGYAELMKNDMVDKGDRKKFAALIYEEAQSMRSLIDDVLTLSRLDEAAVGDSDQCIDLYALAQRTIDRLEGFAQASRVVVRLNGKAALLTGSETVAEQMLYNLIENGIRYNNAEGTVDVDVGPGDTGPVVKVADTGPGIPDDMKEKVFERFFRLEKSRSKETGGTGLGLAIVKHAVLYHGGTIQVESTPGKGATFILKFPKSKQEA